MSLPAEQLQTEYSVSAEDMELNLSEVDPLYRQHYDEMRERMSEAGVELSPYNPRYEVYFDYHRNGGLLHFVLRYNSEAVGYCNIYITNDMHNQDLIAQEDTIFVVKEHRNGAGRLLSQFVHDDLKQRGVKRMSVTTATDLRVFKWLKRQGYKHTAHHMTITF